MMLLMAGLTIITITYENLQGLKQTATSVQEQSEQDFQWIVIDGGSRDGTPFYMGELSCEKIIEPDEGIYDAMNKGIKRAKGDYTIFMNAGDTFASKNDVATILKTAQRNPDFIYGDALEGGQYKTARPHQTMMHGMFTHHQSMIYKTTILKPMLYDSNLNIAADYDLTLRFLRQCEDVAYIPQPLCVFEQGGLSQRNQKQGRREQYKVRKKLALCSWQQNISIYLRQALASQIRYFCPNLYWKVKNTLTKRLANRYNPPTK